MTNRPYNRPRHVGGFPWGTDLPCLHCPAYDHHLTPWSYSGVPQLQCYFFNLKLRLAFLLWLLEIYEEATLDLKDLHIALDLDLFGDAHTTADGFQLQYHLILPETDDDIRISFANVMVLVG